MMAFLRMFVPLMIVLTVVYTVIALYSRSVRKTKLEQEWDTGPHVGDRDDFIDAGLSEYHRSFRRKLILLVYILPLALIALLVYLSNYY